MPDTQIDTRSAFPSATTAETASSESHPELIASPKLPERIASSDRTMLSIARVAERFGRSPRTVRWWIATGRLPAVRIGRTPFVPVEALDRMVDEALYGGASEIKKISEVV